MATLELDPDSDQSRDTVSRAAVAFIASYSSPSTRRTYTTQLQLWLRWCAHHHLDPLDDVRRPHVELYARQLEARGRAPATIALKIVVLTGYHRYCVEEQLIDHSPAVHVRRPRWVCTLGAGRHITVALREGPMHRGNPWLTRLRE